MTPRTKHALGWSAVILAVLLVVTISNQRPPIQPPPVTLPPATAKRSLGLYLKKRAEGGLTIAEVFVGSAAERAGLEAGDVILGVGGETIGTDYGLLGKHLKALPEGLALRLSVARAAEDAIVVVEVAFDGARYELGLARRLIGEGVAQLVSLRQPDGLWPHHHGQHTSTSVTALVAYALSQTEDDAHRQVADQVLADLLSRRSSDGGLDDPAHPVPHRVYATSLLLLAGGERLSDADREGLTAWLVHAQVQEAQGVGPFDWHYGGWSYHGEFRRGRLRTDVSTARFALAALSEARLPAEDPVWQRASLFLDLTQNHSLSTAPDDPLRGDELKLRDGGFSFTPRNSKAGGVPLGDELIVGRSYGSATADGLLALLAVRGIDERRSRDGALPADERSDAALQWLAWSYTLDAVPGFGRDPAGWAQAMRLYYLAALAQALHKAGVWAVVDGQGRRHVWADEIVRALGQVHGTEHEFVGASALMHEDRRTIASSFAIIALAAARDRLVLGAGSSLEARAGRPAPPPLDTEAPLPASATAIQRGQVLFQRWGCTGCHVDGQSANAPSLVGIGDVYLGELRTKARAWARLRAFLQEPKVEARLLSRGEAYGTKMPPLTTGVDGGLDDLLTFLLSRSGQLPVSDAR